MKDFPQTISDNVRKSYVVEFLPVQNSYCFIRLKDGPARVAEMNWTECGEDLRINDLRVSDKAVYPESELLLWLKALCKIPKKRFNFQNRGLGTALLQATFTYARANGFKRVIGTIQPFDLNNRPSLPAWYRKLGFYVPESGLGMIVKELT